jgi:hypothetical protein
MTGKYLIGALIVAVIAVYAAWKGGPFLILLALPVFAWFAARALVHGGFGLWGYGRQGSKAEWNGQYYEYGDIQLRSAEAEGQLVFVESDLLKVIEQPKSKTVELFGAKERWQLAESGEIVLTQSGCERLLLKCPHRDAKKLMLFLQREAFFPYARRHGRLPTGLADLKTTTTEEKT